MDVTATLQEKRGKFHIVLYWYQNGERQRKWVSTGLPVKGNKRKAEQERQRVLKEYQDKITESYSDIYFDKFLLEWLEIVKGSIAETTYSEYKRMLTNCVCPYFAARKITLTELKAYHIQSFYTHKLSHDGVKATTVLRYHANIRKALQYAVKTEMIIKNPADSVELPKKEKFVGSYYSELELARLFKVVKGTQIETPVILAAYYGFRLGEVIGLKWSDIDFLDKTISVTGTVTQRGEGIGNGKIKVRDWQAKNNSSLRTLPLVPVVEDYLNSLKDTQDQNKKMFGQEYQTVYENFICVRAGGELIPPSYVSENFSRILKKHDLRKIRFHDLRHSCATLLLGQGVSMKDVQVWLGHKDMATTANIYAHVEYKSKLAAAEKLQAVMPKVDAG